jgi:hypothetical protein
MTMHLQKFVDRVRGLEARGAKDLTMSMQEAKDLHADITRLLLNLQAVRDFQATKTQSEPETSMQIDGGRFR